MALACVNHPGVMVGVIRCRRCEQTFCRNCLVALRGQYFCASCKRDQLLDIRSGTEAGTLELASIGRRFAALWVDSIVAFVIMLPLMLVLGVGIGALVGGSPQAAETVMPGMMALIMIGGAALVIVYEALMLQTRGRTLGKMAVGLKVVTPDGQDITGGQAWGRAVLRQVFFSYFAVVNYLPAIFTKQKTAVHDLACKTRVVRFRG